MRKLRIKWLINELKIHRWSYLSIFKFWIKEIKMSHERCSYCGWYLHPQLLLNNVSRPSTHIYWEVDGKLICSNCHLKR